MALNSSIHHFTTAALRTLSKPWHLFHKCFAKIRITLGAFLAIKIIDLASSFKRSKWYIILDFQFLFKRCHDIKNSQSSKNPPCNSAMECWMLELQFCFSSFYKDIFPSREKVNCRQEKVDKWRIFWLCKVALEICC